MFDIALTAVDYGYIAEAERDDTPGENVNYICPRIP
jgi:hypothetical protein